MQLRFKFLACDLKFANTHLHYFSKLDDADTSRGFDFSKSRDFWQYTKRAHLEIAQFYLSCVFDKNSSADSLWRFLNDLPKSGLDAPKTKLLNDDLEFCQPKSKQPLIVKLRHWRDNFGAHRNFRLSAKEDRDDLTGLKSNTHKTPSADELQLLFEKGFEILERWAVLCNSSTNIQRIIDDKDDYMFVLDAIHDKRLSGKSVKREKAFLP